MEIPPADYEQKEQKEGVGPLLGIIVIVGLLLAGGIYFLIMQKAQTNPAPAAQDQVNS
jgi:hypothetical protein